MPECTKKALQPSTPADPSSLSAPALPGTTPPQNPTSTKHLPRLAASFSANAVLVVVTGSELSGMSTSDVTPPAAAARVAVSKPSHSVRPGSFTCTWQSTSPGPITQSPKSIAPEGGVEPGTTSEMRSPSTSTAAGLTPSGQTTRLLK